jgi:hypothetical protein
MVGRSGSRGRLMWTLRMLPWGAGVLDFSLAFYCCVFWALCSCESTLSQPFHDEEEQE